MPRCSTTSPAPAALLTLTPWLTTLPKTSAHQSGDPRLRGGTRPPSLSTGDAADGWSTVSRAPRGLLSEEVTGPVGAHSRFPLKNLRTSTSCCHPGPTQPQVCKPEECRDALTLFSAAECEPVLILENLPGQEHSQRELQSQFCMGELLALNPFPSRNCQVLCQLHGHVLTALASFINH